VQVLASSSRLYHDSRPCNPRGLVFSAFLVFFSGGSSPLGIFRRHSPRLADVFHPHPATIRCARRVINIVFSCLRRALGGDFFAEFPRECDCFAQDDVPARVGACPITFSGTSPSVPRCDHFAISSGILTSRSLLFLPVDSARVQSCRRPLDTPVAIVSAGSDNFWRTNIFGTWPKGHR